MNILFLSIDVYMLSIAVRMFKETCDIIKSYNSKCCTFVILNSLIYVFS